MKKKAVVSKWKNDFYFEAYRLARDGMTDGQIAKVFRVSADTFGKWLKKRPSLANALSEARRKDTKPAEEFRNYIHGRLPPRAQRLWDELEAAERQVLEGGPREQRESMVELISTQGKRMRQQLFVHALVCTNFVISQACRRVGVSVTEVKSWMSNDDAFAELVRGVHQCKKDFFESALMDLIHKREPSAVIFVNKTVNKDRGYGEPKDDEPKRVLHEHRIVLDDMPVEAKRAALEAVRRNRPRLEDNRQTTDVELE